MSQEGQVRVTLADGQEVTLRDRAADIVRYVATLAAEVSDADWGGLAFSFSEGDTKAEFTRRSVLKRSRPRRPAL